MLVLFIVWESLTPGPMELQVEQGDKLGHMAAYLALMSWFANIYEDTAERVACLVACMALGVGLEFAQRLTATRTFEIADMAAGAIGVINGFVVASATPAHY